MEKDRSGTYFTRRALTMKQWSLNDVVKASPVAPLGLKAV